MHTREHKSLNIFEVFSDSLLEHSFYTKLSETSSITAGGNCGNSSHVEGLSIVEFE